MSNNKIHQWSFYFLAALFILLPFHAFGITFLNQIFFDVQTTAPLVLKIWKEVIILFLAILLCIQAWQKQIKIKFDRLDYFILIFGGLGFLTAIFFTKKIAQSFFGAKYAFEFLVLFLIVRHFDFSASQKKRLITFVLNSAAIVILFGLLYHFFLPPDFLVNFGYSPQHSHFSPNKPLAYCQKISGTTSCRVQSFLAGPNQLGSYLLVVLPLFLIPLFQKIFPQTHSVWTKIKNFFQKKINYKRQTAAYFIFFLWGVLVLLFSYSRSSLLGFGAILFIILLQFIKSKKQRWIFFSSLLIAVLSSLLILQLLAPRFFQEVLFRPSSTQGHAERMMDGIKFSLENPLGLGLGKAGPASNHFAQDYLGFIPESWYLQVSLEMGLLGLALYLSILGLILYKLSKLYKLGDTFAFSLFLSLIGIMIGSLFLHSWEDSPTALTYWGLLGLVL